MANEAVRLVVNNDGISASVSTQQLAQSLNFGGGGGTFDGMEARVTALEVLAKQTNEKLDKIIDKMSKVEVDVARLDGKVTSLPSAEAFGHLRGRVDSLPTIPKIAAVFGIIGVLISIASNWDKLYSLIHTAPLVPG
ncbi:hypothetical protein [Phyllobacterium leguminum]|uniref:Uncharacterized protein n=1 Tax=Phyllobacterium leguminum TaxID=314237 RepID=A0A318T5W5_9HYPH|nr:hypothetical protein [Phyllobacterium leguminum]PYE89627.1 hypothetical protein C7477_103135 [Phyllobacterium leguminum]